MYEQLSINRLLQKVENETGMGILLVTANNTSIDVKTYVSALFKLPEFKKEHDEAMEKIMILMEKYRQYKVEERAK